MDQLRSVLNQVGGDAKEMQQAMSLAFKQIVVGFIDVGKALGSFVAGAFKDTAAEVVSFVGRLTGLGTGLEWAKVQFTAMTTESNKFTSALGRAGLSVVEFLGTNGIAALATGLGALVITLGLGAAALLQLSKEQTAVAQSNAQFGAAFGASTEEVLAFNKELSTLGITSSKSAELFSEIVKAGGITKDMFIDVSVAANEFEKYVGGKASDAIKQFAEVIKDPVKTLTEFGIQTGFVSNDQIELVKNLLETGQGLKAQKTATEILKQGYASMTDESKAKMSSLDLVLIEMGSSLSALWDNFKNSEGVGAAFKVFWQALAVTGAEVWFVFKQIGTTIGGLFALVNAPADQKDSIWRAMKEDSESAGKAQEDLIKRIMEGETVATAISEKTKQQNTQELVGLKNKKILNDYLQKGDKDNLSRLEYQEKQLRELNTARNGELMTEKEILAVKRQAGQEWDKAHKQKKDPAESFYDSSIKTLVADLNSATGAQEKYTKAQVDFLNITANPKWKELTDSQKKDITLKAEQAIAAEKLVLAQKEELKVQLELQKVWDATVKARAAQDKIDFDLLDTTMALVQSGQAENEMLILQATLIGATDEVRKKSIKLKEIDIKYEKELAKIKAGTASDDAKKTAISDLAKWREQEEKNVNLIIANDAAEKLLAEYNRIRDGITDSIVTALFEGGKAGSKKLRDLLVAELKKPITMVVNALVNTLLGGVTGSVGSSIGTSIASGVGGSALGGALTSVGMAGSTGLANIVGMLGGDSMGVMMAGASGGFGSALGAALMQVPVWGWIVGGLALIASLLDDSGTMHTGGAATWNATTGTTVATAEQMKAGNAFGTGFADTDYGTNTSKTVADIARGLGMALNSVATTFGKKAGYEIATAFADDTSKDGAWGALIISQMGKEILNWKDDQTSKWAPKIFADGEQGTKEYDAALAKSMMQVLDSMDLPEWASNVLDSIGDDPSLEQVKAALQAINDIPKAILQSIGTSIEALSGIIYQGMQQGDPEGAGRAFADQITYGIEASMYQGFAANITNIISTQLITPILTAMATGATLTEAMSKASIETMITQIKNASSALGAIMNDPSFREALAQINGTIRSAVSGSISSVGIAPSAPTSYGSGNSSLQERVGLENRLLQLQGNIAVLRERELAGLDASNRAIQIQIYALEDAKEAQDSYTKALDTANSKISQAENTIASIRSQATNAYLSAQDQVTVAQENITNVLRDQAIAAAEAAQAIRDLGAELRKYVFGELATSQQQFTTVLAKAMQGDKSAMSELSGAATSAIASAIAKSSSASEARVSKSRILQQVMEVAAIAEATSIPVVSAVEDALTKANRELATAQSALAAALNVANTISAPLVSTLGDLISQYNTAMQELNSGQSAAQAAQAALNSIVTNTANTASNTGTTAVNTTNTNTTTTEIRDLQKAARDALLMLQTGTGMQVTFDASNPYYSLFMNINRTNELMIDGLQLQLTQLLGVGIGENLVATGSQDSVFMGMYTIAYKQLQALSNIEYYAAVTAIESNNTNKHLIDVMSNGSSFQIRGATSMFAAGGAFTNSVVSRPTAFNMGMMGEAGPEAILPLTNVGGSLGVRAISSGDNSAVVQELRSIWNEISNLRHETRATALNTSKMNRNIERAIVTTNDGEALQTKAVV